MKARIKKEQDCMLILRDDFVLRMAAYVAERDKGGDVAAPQQAVREQYEIDKSKGVTK